MQGVILPLILIGSLLSAGSVSEAQERSDQAMTLYNYQQLTILEGNYTFYAVDENGQMVRNCMKALGG